MLLLLFVLPPDVNHTDIFTFTHDTHHKPHSEPHEYLQPCQRKNRLVRHRKRIARLPLFGLRVSYLTCVDNVIYSNILVVIRLNRCDSKTKFVFDGVLVG